jgi:hypothetical protein
MALDGPAAYDLSGWRSLRSWWLINVCDRAGTEWRRAHDCEVDRGRGFGEEGLAAAECDGVDEQAVFIDQSGLDEASGEYRAAVGEDRFARLVLQAPHLVREVATGDSGVCP